MLKIFVLNGLPSQISNPGPAVQHLPLNHSANTDKDEKWTGREKRGNTFELQDNRRPDSVECASGWTAPQSSLLFTVR